MTITIASAKVGKNYIFVDRVSGSEGYEVKVCEMQDNDRCGYPFVKNTYATREQALRRFTRLKKKYAG